MKILYNFATRSRPDKFLATIKNIQDLAEHPNYYILVKCDVDDKSMSERFSGGLLNKQTILYWGVSENKIHAINRGVNEFSYDWDILINVSDDMVFQRKGFDLEIIKDFDDDLDQFLHYNDGNQKANISTLSIIGRKYYDRFKYVYHPDYVSLFSDQEATEVAYMLGKHKYMGDSKILFRHMHPAWGLSENDEQYKKTESLEYWRKDEATYKKRKSIKFELPLIQIKNKFLYV